MVTSSPDTPRRAPALLRIPPAPRLLSALRRRLGGPAGRLSAEGMLTVASYNVHKCVGTDKRFDPDRVARVIEELDADILALQEADRRFGRRDGLLDLAALERRTGLSLVPLSVAPRGHGWHGNALLARGARAIRIRRLVLPGGEPRGAAMVDLELPVGVIRVVGAHLGLLRRHRVRQVAAILDAVAEAGADGTPTLLMGDLNEWRHGASSSLRGLEPAFALGRPGPATFPSRLPLLTLDRVLGHPRGLVLGTAAHDTPLARLASDHLPLKARLDLAALAATTPVPLAATG